MLLVAARAELPSERALNTENWIAACREHGSVLKLADDDPSCGQLFQNILFLNDVETKRAVILSEIAVLRTRINYNAERLAPGLTIDKGLLEGRQPREVAQINDRFGQLVFMDQYGMLSLLPMPSALSILFLTISMGVLGSVITMTWSFLQPRGDGDGIQWFLLRPLIGALSAVVLFVLFKAGQMTIAADDVNATLDPFVLSLVGIIGGLLSDRAYRRMESVGEKFLSPPQEPNRYGINIPAIAQTTGVTVDELAKLLGTSANRMNDVLTGIEPATPEEQRILAARLGSPRHTLFTDLAPV